MRFRAPRVAVELRSNLAGMLTVGERNGRAGEIRTRGLLVPNEALYQAEPRPDKRPAGECLQSNPTGGNYFARAKLRGKEIKQSLENKQFGPQGRGS
jgi:hypothetical protein